MVKNIAIIVYDSSVLGGAEKVAFSLANELSSCYHVTLLSLQGDTVHPALAAGNAVPVRFLQIPADRLRSQVFSALIPLVSFLRDCHIDVALVEGNYCGFLCSFARLFVGTKLIFCDHGSCLSQYNERSIRTIRRLSTILCQHTVVLTERSRNDYIRFFRIPENRISCIYNWPDLCGSDPDSRYRSDSRTIISVGRFGREKGYDLLVKVAAIVLPKHKDWNWVIYGDGETFEEIKTEVQRNHLDRQLMLAGVKQDLRDVYKNASFLVLPSYREGMPLVLLEAKSFHLPLVSFDIVSGPREIIQDRVNGYLIESYNIVGMAEAVEKLISDPKLRQTMSDHAYDNMQQFEKASIVKKWRDLIDTLGDRI